MNNFCSNKQALIYKFLDHLKKYIQFKSIEFSIDF